MNQKHLPFHQEEVQERPRRGGRAAADGAPMTLAEVFEEHGIAVRLEPRRAGDAHRHVDVLPIRQVQPQVRRPQFPRRNSGVIRRNSRNSVTHRSPRRYNPLGVGCAVFQDRQRRPRPLLRRAHRRSSSTTSPSRSTSTPRTASDRGRDREEQDELAARVVDHKLYSPHNRWPIQVPRSPILAAPPSPRLTPLWPVHRCRGSTACTRSEGCSTPSKSCSTTSSPRCSRCRSTRIPTRSST